MLQKVGLKKLTGISPLTGINTSSADKLVVMLRPVTMENSLLQRFMVLVIWPLIRDPNTLITQSLTGLREFPFENTSSNSLLTTCYILTCETI